MDAQTELEEASEVTVPEPEPQPAGAAEEERPELEEASEVTQRAGSGTRAQTAFSAQAQARPGPRAGEQPAPSRA